MNNRMFLNKIFARPIELDSPLLVKWLIVATVLFLSAYLARGSSFVYLFGIIGIIGVLILIRLPRIGLLALLVGSLVAPISIGTGSQTQLNITVILIPALLGLWLADMVRRHKVELVPSSVNLPLFALAISATISLIAGNIRWNLFAVMAPAQTQFAGWAIFVFSAGVVFLVANQIDDQRWLQLFTWLFLVIAGLYMLGRLRVPPFNQLSTLMNGLGADGSVFWIWVAALATGQLLFNPKLHRVIRLGLAGLVGATVYVGFVLARDWASGWLPPLVAIGVIVWLRSRYLAVLLGVAGISLVLVAKPDLIFDLLRTQQSVESYSLMTRDVARQILVEQIFPLSPILGLGPANYYWYTPLYPILGWYVKFNSHNNYVDIIMQTGLIGLFCFFWVIGALGWLGWRLRKQFLDGFERGYIYACLGGIAGTLVACWLADWLLPFVYNIGLRGFRASILAWFFLGGLVSLEQIARRSKTQSIE